MNTQDPTYAAHDTVADEFHRTAPPATETDPRVLSAQNAAQAADNLRQAATFLQQVTDAGELEQALSVFSSPQATVFGKALNTLSDAEKMITLGYLYTLCSKQMSQIDQQKQTIEGQLATNEQLRAQMAQLQALSTGA
jgi:uncharacterized membrane protein YdfJ with MMPL/SSD domain